MEMLDDTQVGPSLGLAPACLQARSLSRDEPPLPLPDLDLELARCIPEHLAQRYRCIPLSQEGNVLCLGMVDPQNPIAIDDIQLITGWKVEPVPLDEETVACYLRAAFGHTYVQRPWRVGPFPLRSTQIEARITGPLAHVTVRQQFHNTLDHPMEALYVFPLPGGAAVHAVRMTVGDRTIEAQIQPKAAARATYAAGVAAGHRSALLEQSRDDIVRALLGNVAPGEEISLELEYVERLEQNLTDFVFRCPLVVGERNPSGNRTSLALHRAETGATLELTVWLDVGAHAPELACSQHAVVTQREGSLWKIELTGERLNRDFVLRYRLPAQQQPEASLLVDDHHFLLTLLPPTQRSADRHPRDVTLLLDRSGSMAGANWSSAVRATLAFLEALAPHDTYQLVLFDSVLETFAGESPAEWLAERRPRGGTDILPALQQARLHPIRPEAVGCVILITDGQVGNEAQIYDYVAGWGGDLRLFALGIDTAVNAAFLREVTRLGGGTCELVTPGEQLEGALHRLEEDTGSPVLTQIELRDAGLCPLGDSVNPAGVRAIFPSRPLCLSGLKQGEGALEVVGRLPNGQEWRWRAEPHRSDNPALGLLWARERLRNLESDQQRRHEVEELALRYGLLSSRTSFVLVDRDEVVEGPVERVVQPSERPFQGMECLEVECTVKDISACDFGPLEFDDDDWEPISLDKLAEMVEEAPILRVVNLILSQAKGDGASQIVMEGTKVSYRVNEVLNEVMEPPAHICQPLVARLRHLCGLPLEGEDGQGVYVWDGCEFHMEFQPGLITITLKTPAAASAAD